MRMMERSFLPHCVQHAARGRRFGPDERQDLVRDTRGPFVPDLVAGNSNVKVGRRALHLCVVGALLVAVVLLLVGGKRGEHHRDLSASSGSSASASQAAALQDDPAYYPEELAGDVLYDVIYDLKS